jgi:hypothetical protein
MEINAISSVGSAPSQEYLAGKATDETNKEKPNVAQEKAPTAPSPQDVIISSTGVELSDRVEASEESSTENNREANKVADAARLQNQQIPDEEIAPEERLDKLNTVAQENPSAVYSTQANVSANAVEALFS